MYFVSATPGRERWARGATIPRHRHARGYVAVVLEGGYVEAGDQGRLHLTAGDVAFHSGFEAHHDQFGANGAQILNLDLPGWRTPSLGLGRICDPDTIARTAERDPAQALELLIAKFSPRFTQLSDWVDDLAAAIIANPVMNLTSWAEKRGLAVETLSRKFRRAFGVTPSRFRVDARARRAWQSLLANKVPLAELAIANGFADQPHMTRAITTLTGLTPGQWRARCSQAQVPVHGQTLRLSRTWAHLSNRAGPV